MYDLISIGNISIDIYFKGESLTFKDGRFNLAVGGKYFADSVTQTIGGGGANVAIGAAKHSLKTAVLGKIGNNPFKKIILDKLEENKVSTRFCQIEDEYLNISSILLTEKGERSIIHYTTPHQHIFDDEKKLYQLSEARMVYLANMPNVSLSERIDILHYLKKLNILTIVNLGVKDCRRSYDQLERFLKYVDILIVNGHEFADMVKAPYADIHFKDNVVDWYIPHMNEKIVVITEGAKGSYGYNQGKIYYQEAIKVDKIADTTGAGDGYSAGFVSEYFKSRNLERAMEKAAKYASKILAKIGAN